MSKLVWDQTGDRLYETGIDHGILYPLNVVSKQYDRGVAWNGLTSIQETPSGADSSPLYADNVKYLDLRSAEQFGGTIEAYMYPNEFAVLDGTAEIANGVKVSQQKRGTFGLAYRTRIGNDVEGDDHGFKIHLIYGATAKPSDRQYQTVNENPDAIQFSWEISTAPVSVNGFRPTSLVIIDSTKADPVKLQQLINILEGTDAEEAHDAVYAETTDETPVSGKTYYTKAGNVYSEFTGSTFVSGTTYYEMVSPATEAHEATIARLPLPDEIKAIMAA